MNKQALREAMIAEGMIRKASPSLPRPRRNTRAGEKFVSKVRQWMWADIQAQMEQAGVPQKRIEELISYHTGIPTVFDYRLKDLSQVDLIGWIEGKWTPPGPIGYGSAKTYPQILKQQAQQYGGASTAARDQTLSIANKLSNDQKALAFAAMRLSLHYSSIDEPIGSSVQRGRAAKALMEYIHETRTDNLAKMLPILQWAAKCPSKIPVMDY